jgi:hypothetical protein
LALNFLPAVFATLQTAVHPPAKALAAVIAKKTYCPSTFIESGLEVAEHSLISAISNKVDVFESCANILAFIVPLASPKYIADSPANFLSSVTGKLNLVNLNTIFAAASPLP